MRARGGPRPDRRRTPALTAGSGRRHPPAAGRQRVYSGDHDEDARIGGKRCLACIPVSPGGDPAGAARGAGQRPDRARARAAAAQQRRDVHVGGGASRRRDQRAARAAEPRRGGAHDARQRHPRRRRAERDRPRALRRPGGAAERGAGGRAPPRRGRAVLHPRRRLRLLVQPRGDVREVGARDHPRRLRPPHPHHPARRHRRDEPRRRGRGPAPPGLGDHRAGGLRGRRRSGPVPGASRGRAAAVAAEEVLLSRRVPGLPFRRRVRAHRRRARRAAPGLRPRGRASGDCFHRSQPVRPAAGPHLRRDREPRPRHAQVPGHVASRQPAGAGVDPLPARRHRHPRPRGARGAFALRRGRHLHRGPRPPRRRPSRRPPSSRGWPGWPVMPPPPSRSTSGARPRPSG